MFLVKCKMQIAFYDMQTQFFLNIKEASLTFKLMFISCNAMFCVISHTEKK